MSLYDRGSRIATARGSLYAACAGSGAPAVVFDAGLSNDAEVWYAVAPAVATVTTVCLYDRANVGRSAPQPTPRTSQDIADDLDALLAALALPPPSILVGHSFGGWNIRLYAAQHPQSVLGLVLVDTPHEAIDDRYAAILSAPTWRTYLSQWNSEQIDLLASASQVASAPAVPSLRAAVISAARHAYPPGWPEAELEDARLELQARLVAQLPGSRHIRAARSGHMVQIDEPAIVVAAIADLVDDWRTGEQLRARRSR